MNNSLNSDHNKVSILRVLNSKGQLRYDELRNQSGFKTRRGDGIFAYQLRKLLRQSLIAQGKSEKEYVITKLGKLVLHLDESKDPRQSS